MFGFNERYAMLDATPVDNQFILEYLPAAKGDHVKVYLYGLMQCCHPQADATLEQFARELGMTEEEVMAAFRYWERKGLVQRISDKPVAYRYVHMKQLMLTGAAGGGDQPYDDFTEAVYALFDGERRLHGSELQLCYEWVEDMGLPQEVVLELLRHMRDVRGKSFNMKAAQKLAVELAQEGVATTEGAQAYLNLEKTIYTGCREVLSRLGQYRAPTQPETELYRKWIREWGFKPDAVLEACADTTGGRPSFKYLDGILNRYHDQEAASGAGVRKARDDRRESVQGLKKVIAALNLPTLTINEDTRKKYAEMQSLYPEDVILMAAGECAGRGLGFDEVLTTLRFWKGQGLADAAQIRSTMAVITGQNAFLRQLFDLWGRRSRPAKADREALTRWTEEMGFTQEAIIAAAPMAANAEKPMTYLNKLLTIYRDKGVMTPEQIAAYRQEQPASQPARPAGKVVREQQYTQREYEEKDELPAWMQERLKEMNADA